MLSRCGNEGGLGWWGCQRDRIIFLLKENQTSCFLEVHLAYQMVLRFIKAAILLHNYFGCLVLSSWYPSNQSLLLVSSKYSRKWQGTAEFKEGSAPPGQETTTVPGALAACPEVKAQR